MKPLFAITVALVVPNTVLAQARWETAHLVPEATLDEILVTDGGVFVSGYIADAIYMSTDLVSWTSSLVDANAWQLLRSGDQIIAAGSDGVFSTSDGQVWTKHMAARALSVDRVGSRIVAGGYGGQVYESVDDGTSWDTRNGATMPRGFDEWVRSVAVLPTGIVYSHHAGDLLVESGPGEFDENSTRFDTDFVRTASDEILLRDGRDVFRSAEGRTFSKIATAPEFIWEWAVSGDLMVIAGSQHLVYVSKDRGQTWSDWSAGTTVGYANAVAIGPDGHAYYMADGMIQRSTESIHTAVGRVATEPPLPMDQVVVYPNPSESQVKMRAVVSEPTTVAIVVFDALGREVARTDLGLLNPGGHEVYLGHGLAAGAYTVRMQTERRSVSGRLVVVR